MEIVLDVILQLYDLDGNSYDEIDVVQIMYEATIQFKKTHPKFMGSRIIYAPIRIADQTRFAHYMSVMKTLHVSGDQVEG